MDAIPGVGPVRRKALLKHFGSVDKIRSATLDELMTVKGIPLDVAESIKASLE
jgi:excinuclease ABC subunit C